MPRLDVRVPALRARTVAIAYTPTCFNHMMHGTIAGGTHTGLHSLNLAAALPNLTLAALNVAHAGTLNGSNITVTIRERDLRVAGIIVADVTIGARNPKRSCFFPDNLNWAGVQAVIDEAYRDYQLNANNNIYQSKRSGAGITWAGMARIAGQDIWLAARGNPVDTAFPAVNNKFF
ncbi:MAG: EndoU domain-containing protein [Acidobacteria bacterium]|nr:EndoU domain-containing protein [Acidobacteriota bacterium]